MAKLFKIFERELPKTNNVLFFHENRNGLVFNRIDSILPHVDTAVTNQLFVGRERTVGYVDLPNGSSFFYQQSQVFQNKV